MASKQRTMALWSEAAAGKFGVRGQVEARATADAVELAQKSRALIALQQEFVKEPR
jgi:hypothetical protein